MLSVDLILQFYGQVAVIQGDQESLGWYPMAISWQDYLSLLSCIGHLDKASNGNFGANQGPGHPMLIPVRSPSHRAEQLTKSSKPSLGKVNPNLLVLLASALSWAEETFRLEAVLFKELRVDDFSQFLFPLQSFAKNTTDGSSGEEVWPDWAKVNLLGRFSKFWGTFSNIGQVFCQIWGTLGGFLKPSFTLGRLFLNEELGSSIFSPSESGHTEATMVSFLLQKWEWPSLWLPSNLPDSFGSMQKWWWTNCIFRAGWAASQETQPPPAPSVKKQNKCQEISLN